MGNVPGKKVVNADAGDADHFGGNDLDDIQDFLNDVDKTGPVKINTAWWFRDDKLNFRDSGNDHLYTHSFANLAANRIVNWPLLPTDDTVAFNDMTATLKNKTLDSSCTFSGISPNRSYTSLLYKDGSTYYAIKYDGTVISSSSTAETVIQAALDEQGTVYFADASSGYTDWDLSGAFSGFTVDQHTKIICDAPIRVMINVPNGFAGIAFKFIGTSGALNETVGIQGLSLEEQGTPAKLWTGIKFEIAGTDSLAYSHFSNIIIQHAAVGIELETSNDRWIESCSFRDIELFSCNVAMLFDQQDTSNIHQNIFENIICQQNTLAGATNGFKDIDGTSNIFINCIVWDSATANSEANIKSTANGTIIIGGRMTGDTGHFVDLGIKTTIIGTTTKNGNYSVITRPDFAKNGNWFGRIGTDGDGSLGGALTAIAVLTGTDAGSACDATGTYRTYDTAATINSITGLRSSVPICTRIGNGYFKNAIYLNSVSNVRVFSGLTTSASAPASAADPLANQSGVALWFDSAVSANWKIGYNDGDATGTYDDTTVQALTATLYPVEIYAVNDSRWRFVFNGVSTDITTEIPASTTALCFWVYMENTTGASRTMRHYYVTVRNDK